MGSRRFEMKNSFESQEEVGFDHSIVNFSDGKRQAVMAHYKFKDGKIIFMETAATNLDH